jgi:hypothetical protein
MLHVQYASDLIAAVKKSEINRLREENRGLRTAMEMIVKGLGQETMLDPTSLLVELERSLPALVGEARVISDDDAKGFCLAHDTVVTCTDPRLDWCPEEHKRLWIGTRINLGVLDPQESTTALPMVRLPDTGIQAPISIAAADRYNVLRLASEGKPVLMKDAYSQRPYELEWGTIEPGQIEAAYGRKAAVRARPDKPAVELRITYVGETKG